MQRCLSSKILVLGTFELLVVCRPGFGSVDKKSDVSLVSMHFLFQCFDSVYLEGRRGVVLCRLSFIFLRILCMLSSCVFER